MNSFDITTHMIGIHPTLGIVKGEHWTPLEKMPKVWKMTPTTPARLKKIAARYADFRTAHKLQETA